MEAEKYLLEHSDIVIDSSTLMHAAELRMFIENHYDELKKNAHGIRILESVIQELIRHLFSSDEQKQKLARNAFEVMQQYHEIFNFEQANYEKDSIQRAFADPELLHCLVNIFRNREVLLITNDYKLGKDALKINGLESVYGHKVTACSLGSHGILREVRNEEYVRNESNADQSKEQIVQEQQNNAMPANDDMKFVILLLTSLGALSAGSFIGYMLGAKKIHF